MVKNTIKDLDPITVGELLLSFKDLSNVYAKKIDKKTSDFASLPVRLVIKRVSNNQVVDLLRVKGVEADERRNCFLITGLATSDDVVFTHEGKITKLNNSSIKIGDLINQFHLGKHILVDKMKISDEKFYSIPVRVAVIDKNNKVVNFLEIITSLMDDIGSSVFCHCIIDDEKMMRENQLAKKSFELAEKRYKNLIENVKT